MSGSARNSLLTTLLWAASCGGEPASPTPVAEDTPVEVVPPTEPALVVPDDVRAFAEGFAAAYAEGREKVLVEHYDFTRLLAAQTEGLELGAPQYNGMRVGLRAGMGMPGAIEDALENFHGSFRLLRITATEEDEYRALYRLESGVGFDYWEALVARDDSGAPRIVDHLVWSSGEWNAAASARGYRTFVLFNNPDMVGAVTADDEAVLRTSGRFLGAIERARSSGGDALALVDELRSNQAPFLRNAEWVLLLRTSLAGTLGPARALAAHATLSEAFPDNPAVPLAGIGLNLMVEREDEALRWVEELDALVDDPYLDLLRARVARRQERYDDAAALLERFRAACPDLRPPFAMASLLLAVDREDHAATLEFLLENEREGYLDLEHLRDAQVFDAFRLSPQWDEWQARER